MSSLSLAGGLRVAARWSDGSLHDWRVSLSRPPVSQALVGLRPDEALARLPLYFSLCSQAQTEVGGLALEAGGWYGAEPAPTWRLWSECLHEHLWRLLLDWPVVFGEAPLTASFATWRAARSSRRSLLAATDQLFETVLWVGVDGGLVARGMAHLEHCAAPVRKGFEQRVNALRAAVEEFQADENYPHGSTGQPAKGRGEAWIHTARGALRHQVHVDGGRVAEWRVEAPTDRNFSDEKGIVRLLPAELAGVAAAHQAVERAILVLDPCVPFAVEIVDA